VTFLESTGFHVLTACDGLDALRQLRVVALRPAVILLDLMMPTMDGIEFRRYQQGDVRLREIPVVCLSARHDAGPTAAQLGVSEFLSKPFDLDAVAAAVWRCCSP
jgi:CheY-like chemotaxis protein